MPPKEIIPNLFGERKVFIGTDLCDMKPLEEITRDAITATEEAPTPESINATGGVSHSSFIAKLTQDGMSSLMR